VIDVVTEADVQKPRKRQQPDSIKSAAIETSNLRIIGQTRFRGWMWRAPGFDVSRRYFGSRKGAVVRIQFGWLPCASAMIGSCET